MQTLPEIPSWVLWLGFMVLPWSLIIATYFCTRSYRAVAVMTGWGILSGILAGTNLLADFDQMPPPILFVLGPTLMITAFLSLTNWDKSLLRIPVRTLVYFHAFRIVVEILIHKAAREGIAPPQMSWDGMNLDIITGITAIGMGLFLDRIPNWLLHAWNAMGLFLVCWVVGVAILSMPMPFQQLQPDNVWVAFFPFVWLPAILVAYAIGGHLLLFRKLLIQSRQTDVQPV